MRSSLEECAEARLLFFDVANRVSKAGYARDIASVGDTCISARAEEELWEGIAACSFGPGVRTRLMAAAARGDAARVRFLCARRAPLDARDVAPAVAPEEDTHGCARKSGRTALHWASVGGHVACVAALSEAIAAAGVERASPLLQAPLPMLLPAVVPRAPRRARAAAAAAAAAAVVPLPLLTGLSAVDTDGSSALHWAAREGHEAVVRELLARGAGVDARDTVARTALYFATREGRGACVDVLLSAGADAAVVRDDGWSAVLLAVQQGHEGIFRALVAHGGDARARLHFGWTGVHVAAKNGRASLVRVLASEFAVSPTAVDDEDNMAVHAACGAEAVGAVFEAVDTACVAAVHAACVPGGSSAAGSAAAGYVAAELLPPAAAPSSPPPSRVAVLLARTASACTVLHSVRDAAALRALVALARQEGVLGELLEARNDAAWTPLQQQAARGSGEAVQLLLDAGAVRCPTGDSPLHLAAARKSSATAASPTSSHAVNVVRVLLDAGEAVDCPARGPRWAGAGPLQLAANAGSGAVCALLLARGARADGVIAVARARRSAAPLEYAASRGHLHVVAQLLAAGATPTPTALCQAARGGYADTVRALCAAAPGVTPPALALKTALRLGHASAARELLSAGAVLHASSVRTVIAGLADAGAEDDAAVARAVDEAAGDLVALLVARGAVLERPSTWPLHLAASKGRAHLVVRLCGMGAVVDARDCYHHTALACAVQAGHGAAVRALVGAGAALDARMGWRSGALSVLAFAALCGHATIVDELLSAGAPPSPPALHAACAEGHVAIARTLLARGADVNARDVCGATALVWAARSAAGAVVALLLAAGADASARDSRGRAPVHYAAEAASASVDAAAALSARRQRRRGAPAAPDNRAGVVLDLALAARSVIDVADARGCRPLHLAVAPQSSLATVRILAMLGARVRDDVTLRASPLAIALGNDGDTSRLVRFLRSRARGRAGLCEHLAAMTAAARGALKTAARALRGARRAPVAVAPAVDDNGGDEDAVGEDDGEDVDGEDADEDDDDEIEALEAAAARSEAIAAADDMLRRWPPPLPRWSVLRLLPRRQRTPLPLPRQHFRNSYISARRPGLWRRRLAPRRVWVAVRSAWLRYWWPAAPHHDG